jgi:hypothetical protein
VYATNGNCDIFLITLKEFLTALSENIGIKGLHIKVLNEKKLQWNMVMMLLSGRASSLRMF